MKAFHPIWNGIVLELQPEPEGGCTVTAPALPGCVTYRKTFEYATKLVEDATPSAGQAIAGKIAELVITDRVTTYEREKVSLSPAFEILIGNLGFNPKSAWRVLQETVASTLEELEQAVETGRLAGLPSIWQGSMTTLKNSLLAAPKQER